MKKIFVILYVCIIFLGDAYAIKANKNFSDKFDDLFIKNNSLFVNYTAKNYYIDFENMGDYFNTKGKCDRTKENCNNRPENKFYLKMYDLYYLYLSKYDVSLDLSLIMATLFYGYEETDKIFEMNLSDYDRRTIVENDWKPSETTELDWDYDYESKDNYLVANDSSMDMQVLAKNMVSKITTQKCVKDNKIMKSKKVKDKEEDLVCKSDEILEYGNVTYELDLDKFDDFLLEYIEKKYFLKRYTLFPAHSNGPDYYTDKKPSIINKMKKKKNKASSEIKDGNYVSDVSFMDGKFGKIYYYNQCEEPYSYHSYGGFGSICSHGCGPTSLAIVISSLYDEAHDPIEVTDYLCESGGCSVDGTYHASITSTAEHYGLKVKKTGDTQEVADALSTGRSLVIAIMCPGHFTSSGHFITLTGISTDQQVTVADPASRERSTDWDFNTVVEETCPSNGSPFWIITR